MPIKYDERPDNCPVCDAPPDPLEDVFIPKVALFDCGMELRRGKRRWVVKNFCPHAYSEDYRPYERTVLAALYRGRRSYASIGRWVKKAGWTGQALDSENVERALRSLADTFSIGLAADALDNEGANVF